MTKPLGRAKAPQTTHHGVWQAPCRQGICFCVSWPTSGSPCEQMWSVL